jgi:radical SAM superfamily enzyme YgiQ (UPF0313 family)
VKILLVVPEIHIKFGTYGYQAGVAALSASLKAAGFADVGFLHVAPRFRPERFRDAVAAIRPDVAGFYTTYNQFRFIRHFVAAMPRGVFTVLGGPHPTIAPDCLEQTPGLDAICVGEGDEVIVDLVRALSEGRDATGIPGLWRRTGDEIAAAPPRPFVSDLDALPFEDRTIFEGGRAGRAGLLEISHANSFRLGRGCPFRCTFCSNYAQSKAQPGAYVRFRGLDHVFAELRQVVDRYRPRVLYFQDDTFMSSPEVVRRFCARYREEVGLPFEFFGRIDLITEDLLRTIADAGGRRVSYGIESGDERTRTEVLGKRFTNQDAVRAFRTTKEVGLVAEAFVMAGYPEETPESFRRTADLLREIQPDLYTLSTYFPNPGTALYQRSREAGMLRDGTVPLDVVNQRDLMLDLPHFGARAFRSARRWFAFRVYGRTSPLKAVLFFAYESWLGDRLLRWLSSPLGRRLRAFALSLRG